MSVPMMSVLGAALGELRHHPVSIRVRAEKDGVPVVDSTTAVLVWEPRRIVSVYAVPIADLAGSLVDPDPVRPDLATLPPALSPRHPFDVHSAPGRRYTVDTGNARLDAAAYVLDDPDLGGHALLDWTAFDRWYEEGEEVRGHPREPFHSIRCLASDRHVTVSVDGEVVADSLRPVLLVETMLPPRWYLPREDVRMDRLTRSDSHTTCAYKGEASYFGVPGLPDIAWTYEDPRHEAEPVRDHVCFYAEATDLTVDGEALPRPVTDWSGSRT